MSATGDDCYFFYYSTCVKGDLCPFRHQPEAQGCEITCHLWEKGRCFKKTCNFRHMLIEKDRSQIPCHWEALPHGCIKSYCPFLHLKPRQVSGGPPPRGPPPPISRAEPPRMPVSKPAMSDARMPVPGNIPGNQIRVMDGNMRLRSANPNTFGPMRLEGPPGHIQGMAMIQHPPYSGPPGSRVPFNQGPYMGGPRPMPSGPMSYGRGIPPGGQLAHPGMYQMQQNNPSFMAHMHYPGMRIPRGIPPGSMINPARGDFSGFKRFGIGDDFDDDDDYTSSDFSDVSLSDLDDDDDEFEKRRPQEKSYSSRRVCSPRREVHKREVRHNNDKRRKPSSKPSHERLEDKRRDRAKERGRERERDNNYNREKDRERDRELDKNRSRSPEPERLQARRKKRSDNEDGKDSSDTKEKTSKDSSTEKNKSSPAEEETSDNKEERDIKIKTLEEILREKALKKLHERTAAKKKEQQKRDEESKAEKDNQSSDDTTEPSSPKRTLKSVVAVSPNKPDIVSKDTSSSSEESDSDEGSTKESCRTPKKIIRSVVEVDKGNQGAPKPQVPKKLVRRVKEIEPEETDSGTKELMTALSARTVELLEGDKSDSAVKPVSETVAPSPDVNVKSFEEIMTEKRLRKAQMDLPQEGGKELTSATSTGIASKPENSIALRLGEKTSKESDPGVVKKVLDLKPKGTRRIHIVKKGQTLETSSGTEVVGVTEAKSVKSRLSVVQRRTVMVGKPETAARKEDAPVKLGNTSSKPEQTDSIKTSDSKPLQKPKQDSVLVKSFEDIMREKKQRKTQEGSSEKTEIKKEKTATLAVAGPRQLQRNKLTKPSNIGEVRVIKTRKLKVIRKAVSSSNPQQDESSTKAADRVIPLSITDTCASVESGLDSGPVSPSSNTESTPISPASRLDSGSMSPFEGAGSIEFTENCELPTTREEEFPNNDDDSWSNEALPAIEETFTENTELEEPSDDRSPTKRPRSSLEKDTFDIPAEEASDLEQKPPREEDVDSDEEEVSPAKRAKTQPPTYEEIVQAVTSEMAKKDDDFDLDLEEAIANLSPGASDDHLHETMDEDDLLMELEEMINE